VDRLHHRRPRAVTRHVRRLGIQPDLFLEAIDGGQPDSPYAHLKGKEMLAGQYPASFAVGGATKDLGLMLDAALGAKFPQILLRPLHQLYSRAGTAGHSHDDIAAVYTEFDPGARR
jgi:3-hydroxyisobutyrate dehydrogenase